MDKAEAFPKFDKCDCYGKDDLAMVFDGIFKVPKKLRGPRSRKISYVMWHMERFHKTRTP